MEVLYEDNHLIVVNKKCGEIVQGDITGDKTLGDDVKSYLKQKYNKPFDVFLGVTHRLDRPTSGIVIFAKTSKALTRMNKLFADNEIKKKYFAVVDNKPFLETAKLEHYLTRNTVQNKSYAHDNQVEGSKKASLTYKVKEKSDRYYLLEIELHTGRHHQIRAQLAKINCRIKGDLKYGFARSNTDGGIHLHAGEVRFVHPVSKEPIFVKAPPPDDVLWNSFKKNM